MKKLPIGVVVLGLLLGSCAAPPTPEVATAPAPQSTQLKVLTQFASSTIEQLGSNGEITFSKPAQLPLRAQALEEMKLDDVTALTPGTIVASAPTATAPYGLLRRVLAVHTAGDKVTLETEPATLEEALASGNFKPGQYHLTQKIDTSRPIFVQTGQGL